MPDARRFEEVLSRCAAGAMPARMAAMHLLIESESSEPAPAPTALSLVWAGQRPWASWDLAAYHLLQRPCAATPRQ